MQSRTHTCGELRVTDAGKRVKICGWMENVREVSGALAFVVVRDFYGTTQVVAETCLLYTSARVSGANEAPGANKGLYTRRALFHL